MTDSRIDALLDARLHEPHALLGVHAETAGFVARHFDPHATRVSLRTASAVEPMIRVANGLFEWRGPVRPPAPLTLRVEYGESPAVELRSPYAFEPEISADDLYLFNEGRQLQAWRMLGAQPKTRAGCDGVRFACWAPNAERVSVVGDFNRWDGRCHPMHAHGGSGVWELFVPGLAAGALYKFEIRNRAGAVLVKADPYAQQFELRPSTAARVAAPSAHRWGDAAWLGARAGDRKSTRLNSSHSS